MPLFRKAAAVEDNPAETQPATKISELLPPAAIKLNLEAADKEEAFEELVDLLMRCGSIHDREGALQALRDREKLMSTGIGNGVAIPHGKHPSVNRLVAALGISPRGVEFDALDGKPANLVFVLLARPDNPGPHIQALAEIARLIQSPGLVKRLLEAHTPTEVLDIIRAEE